MPVVDPKSNEKFQVNVWLKEKTVKLGHSGGFQSNLKIFFNHGESMTISMIDIIMV